ncbi:MAG: hypothetical protein AAB263_05785 [Planctomycetota bacterium]
MLRALLCMMIGVASLAALTLDVEETTTGIKGSGGDVAELERMEALEKARLKKARAEIDQLPKAVARLIRQDIGAGEAELDRIAMSLGKTIVRDRYTFQLEPGKIVYQNDQRRVVFDLVGRTATEDAGEGNAPRPLALEPAPKALSIEEGKPGDVILGRKTLQFVIVAQSRTYTVMVDTTLVNPYAHMQLVGGEANKLDIVLGKLPGFPLLIVDSDGRSEHRRAVREIK